LKRTLHVAAACDESYAMPLAVVLASLSENLSTSRVVRVHILQRQLSRALRDKVERSIPRGAVEFAWIDIESSELASLRATLRRFDTVALESYYRLLLPSVLPDDIDTVLYLDSDLVVRGDVTPLWDLDIASTSLFAVPELAPASSLVSSPEGIPLHRELELPPDLKFFNSGVMLINLRKWRDEHVALRAFLYLDAARHYLRWHDQEALNAILVGDWRELDPCWNVTMHLFRGATGSAQRQLALREPRIVHYNSAIKPWQPDFCLGFRDLFFEYLDKTAWSGWRPGPRSASVLRLKKRLLRAMQKRGHLVSSKADVLRHKVAGWRAARRQIERIDLNPVLHEAHDELLVFVNVIEPKRPLSRLLSHYDELSADRVFMLVDGVRAAEARSLASVRINLHVIVKKTVDDRSTHLLLRNLLRRFAKSRWCVMLDSNELLSYRNAKSLSLKQLCGRLDEDGFSAVIADIVDLEPLPASASLTGMLSDPLRLHKKDTFLIRSVAKDPVTQRIFPAPLLLEAQQGGLEQKLRYRCKVALFRYRDQMSIAEGFRAVQGVRAAEGEAAVLRMRDLR
jgi:lipopolysaccharide biosynthesis glycosyltransferase